MHKMVTTVLNIYLLVCACIGLTYGLSVIFGKKPPMYFKLMVFPIACQVFTRAFYTIAILCYGNVPVSFNIGLLGFAAFFLFLYLPNVGTIDSLVDEHSKMLTIHRLIPLAIPLAEAAAAAALMIAGSATLSACISFAVLTACAGFAGYFNMKHLIIPDVEDGIVRSLRKFNFVCIVLEVLSLAEVGVYYFFLVSPVAIQIPLGIMYIAFLPFLNKEMKKWIQ